MEHYEVEDVRNRPKKASTPLRLDIVVRQDVMLLLHVKNDHDSQSLKNLKFQFESNVDLDLSARDTLTQRGLRSLRAGSELFFNLDTALNILRQSEEAELTVRVDYEFMGSHVMDSFVFHLGDYKMSAVVTSDELNLMKKLIDKIGDLVREVDHLRRDGEPMRRMLDDTGLRISHRTISALRGEDQKFDPAEFDASGYQLILSTSRRDAFKLYDVFHYGSSDRKKEYYELPGELRQKFEEKFKVEF